MNLCTYINRQSNMITFSVFVDYSSPICEAIRVSKMIEVKLINK